MEITECDGFGVNGNGIRKCFMSTLYFFSWTCIQLFDLYTGLENSIIKCNKFTFSWPLSLTNLVLQVPVKKETQSLRAKIFDRIKTELSVATGSYQQMQ